MSDAQQKPAPPKPVMVTEEQALEKYTYRPMDKVGSVGTLKALLQAQERSLAAVLPKHLTPDRLFKTLLIAVNRQPDLLECTQSSIVLAVGQAAELGLDVSGTLQEAFILPFNNNLAKKGETPRWVKQAQLIPGYRGLARLARNSGEVVKIEARVVKANDFFELEFGSTPRLVFRPLLRGDRGKTLSVYAFVKLASGEEVVDWMTAEDVEKIRRMSKQPESLMWRDHWDEGARKTVFRRLSKWLPLSPEKAQKFLEAVTAADAEFDLDAFAQALVVEPGAATGVAALEERLAGAGATAEAGARSDGVGPGEMAEPAGGEAAVERRLRSEQVAEIRNLAKQASVSLDDLEGRWGGKLESLEFPDRDRIKLEQDLVRDIRETAKKGRAGK